MRQFFDTTHCRGGARCRTCRDLEAGRKWRLSIRAAFEVPDLDWECLRGHPWGWTGPTMGLGDTVAKVIKAVVGIKPCGGCHKRREALNALVPYRRA